MLLYLNTPKPIHHLFFSLVKQLADKPELLGFFNQSSHKLSYGGGSGGLPIC